MYKILLTIICSAFCLVAFAQEKVDNLFLDRDFLKTKPSVEVVKQKIAEGHDPTEKDLFGFDAVSYGILDEIPNETLKYLLTLEGNPVTKPTHGDLPYLLWAAYRGNTEIVKHLLELGSDIHFASSRGTNILLMSGIGGQEDIELYKLMFSNGVDPNYTSDSKLNILLALARSDAKDENLYQYLIEKGLDWHSQDEEGNGFFHYSAMAGNVENMKMALREGVDFKVMNANGENAMFYATYGRRRREVKLETFMFMDSLGLDADIVNWEGQTPLHYAVRNGNTEVIDFFLDRGVNINQIDKNGNTAFMNSIFGDVENVEKLVPLVDDINRINHKGQSALSRTVIYSLKDAFNHLVDQGADLAVIDENGDDLISLAFQNYSDRRKESFEQILTVITDKGMVAQKSYASGNTLIHFAIEKNSAFLVEKALEMNANPNFKNELGLTALHLAAMKATDSEIIDMLLNFGADKRILTDFEESPHDLASENEILIFNKTDISQLQLQD